jgi:hypothetical protein
MDRRNRGRDFYGIRLVSALLIAQWLQATGFFTFLRESGYVYPIVLTVHVVGIAMFGGLVLLTDLRLLGLAMRNWTVSEVVDQLRVLKWIGFTIVGASGILLTGCKAAEYYNNRFFWIKILLLGLVGVHALVFRRGVSTNAPAQVKLAGALSLILWLSIVLAGRGIGYIEPQLDRLHALILSDRSEPASAPTCARSRRSRHFEPHRSARPRSGTVPRWLSPFQVARRLAL